MEIKAENKSFSKDKILNIFNLNKKKIYITFLILLFFTILTVFIKFKNERENTLIAEKYIKAGIYLSSNQKDLAKKTYEEIIKSKNKFYAILALNTVIERDLITEKNIILNYFNSLEKQISNDENKDLVIFKKALFLLKIKDNEKGNNLLRSLVNKNSLLSPLAKELLD